MRVFFAEGLAASAAYRDLTARLAENGKAVAALVETCPPPQGLPCFTFGDSTVPIETPYINEDRLNIRIFRKMLAEGHCLIFAIWRYCRAFSIYFLVE